MVNQIYYIFVIKKEKMKEEGEIKELNILFRRAFSKDSTRKGIRKKWEDFYYSDVEGNMNQFDSKQLGEIKDTYSIPISTKYQYPIIEQLVAFLTGLKPYPRLISAADSVKEFVEQMHKAYQGVFYEAKTDNLFRQALIDYFVTGMGFLRVRKNNFYNETTFNVTHEYIPWHKVYIDPDCEKEDLSDADYVIIAEVMDKKKAQKKFGINIPKDALISQTDDLFTNSIGFSHDDYEYGVAFDSNKIEYCWVREFFIRDEVNVYISDNGMVTHKRPEMTEMPNPEIAKINMAIIDLKNTMSAGMQAQNSLQMANDMAMTNAENPADRENYEFSQNSMLQLQQQMQQQDSEMANIQQQIKQLEIQKKGLPKIVPAYVFIDDDGNKEISLTSIKIRKKYVRSLTMVGDVILDREFEPSEAFPLINLVFQMQKKTRNCLGIMHWIQDLIKGMNKLIGLSLYDLALNPSSRYIAPEDSIQDSSKWETKLSTPGGVATYTPDPSNPNYGKPEPVPHNPMNQTITYLLDTFFKMIEYITGIYGVLQGNTADAPETLGATQSLQNFGTQRVKLYARNIEYPLQQLAYVTVCYLRKYVPKNKMLVYFDDKDNPQTLEVFDSPEDMKFKVRVEIAKSLPTLREMFGQLLARVAGQTQNPYVADMLTQYMLTVLDFPEGDVMAKKMDIIKQMEQELNSLKQQLDTMGKRNNALENNMYHKELSNKVNSEAQQAQSDIELEKQLAIQEVQNGTEETETKEINQTIF